MAFDRGQVSVGLSDGTIEILKIPSGDLVRGWKGHDDAVKSLFLACDGRLVSGSLDGSVTKWDFETGSAVWSRGAGVGEVIAVNGLADGRLVVGGIDGSVRVLDGATGHEIMACRGHTNWVNAVIPLGFVLGSFASGSEDTNIRVWASDGALVRVVEAGWGVASLSLSPCGDFVAAGCEFGIVRLFRFPEWDLAWSVEAHVSGVLSVAWSPGGRLLATGSGDGTTKIISVDTGATLSTCADHTNAVTSVLFVQDGTKVLSGSEDKTIRVWRIFWPTERRARALCAGLVVDETDDFERDGLCEVVRRTKRLWEVEAD